MASPSETTHVGTNITTAATSHAINVGSPAAGALIIVCFRFATDPGTRTFTGYTVLLAAESSDLSANVTSIYYRWADGTEGTTDTLTTSNSVKLGALAWVIANAQNPSLNPPEVNTATIGGTAANACDPGAITPAGGSKDYLFIAIGAADGENAFTAAPTNYINFVAANSGITGSANTNVFMGGGNRALTASTENPGAFTHSGATTGETGLTVAVYPRQVISTKAGYGKENG